MDCPLPLSCPNKHGDLLSFVFLIAVPTLGVLLYFFVAWYQRFKLRKQMKDLLNDLEKLKTEEKELVLLEEKRMAEELEAKEKEQSLSGIKSAIKGEASNVASNIIGGVTNLEGLKEKAKNLADIKGNAEALRNRLADGIRRHSIFQDDEEEEEEVKPKVVLPRIVDYKESFEKSNSASLGPSHYYREPCLQYLRVKLVEAEVPAYDVSGTTDTYATFECGLMKTKSKVKMRSLHPVWNEELVLGVLQGDDRCQLKNELKPETVDISLWDWDATQDERIGTIKIPLTDIPGYDDTEVSPPVPKWYPIEVEDSFASKFYQMFTLDITAEEGPLKQLWTGVFGGSTVKDGRLIEKDSKFVELWKYMIANEEEREENRKQNKVNCKVCLALWFDTGYKELVRPPLGRIHINLDGLKLTTKDPKNPYVVLQYDKHWVRMPTLWNTREVSYNRDIEFAVYEPSSVITIAVIDDKPTEKDELLGKLRIRVSWLRRLTKIETTQPLFVRYEKVRKNGEIKFSLFYDCPSWVGVIARYAQPPLAERHYYEPLGPNEVPLLKFHEDAMKLYLSTAEPSIDELVVEQLLAEKLPTFDVDTAKANVERLKHAGKPFIAAVNWFDDICMWKNFRKSLIVNIIYVFMIFYPQYLAALGSVGLAVIYVQGYFKYMKNWQLPQMDPSIYGGVEEEKEETIQDAIPFENPLTSITRKLDELLYLGGKVQNILGDVAGIFEKIRSTPIWRDPLLSGVFTTIFIIAAPGVLLVPVVLKPLLAVVGLFVMRHPILRDPLPPPPVNMVARMPSDQDILLN